MHLYTFDLPSSLQMGELKVVYKLPEFGLFGSAGHRLKKNQDWHFQTAPIPKHRGTARLVWNWNKTFLGKFCISGSVYSLAGIRRHVPSGSVVSSLTWWVKPRFGENLIVEVSSKKLRNHFPVRYWSLSLWSLGTDQEIQLMYQITTGLSFLLRKNKGLNIQDNQVVSWTSTNYFNNYIIKDFASQALYTCPCIRR